jgi:hypothetical protein
VVVEVGSVGEPAVPDAAVLATPRVTEATVVAPADVAAERGCTPALADAGCRAAS